MNFLEKRKRIYDRFPKDKTLTNFLLMYDVCEKDFVPLQDNVKQYITETLSIFYNEKISYVDDSFLDSHYDKITNLPNITKNGIIFPKKETIDYFTEIQKSINDILQSLKLDQVISQLGNINLRIKNINESDQTKNRPYYTGSLHSDAWVGHQGDSICMIGVLGDVEGATVEYYEPVDVDDNFMDIAENFDEGNKRYKSLKYLGQMQEQHFVVMDHACVHRTALKPNCKSRVSIDFPIITNSKFSNLKNAKIIKRFAPSFSYWWHANIWFGLYRFK